MVSDYTNMSFSDVLALDCITFRYLLKDAFIAHMATSEEGRDFLEQAWMLKQTSPDRKALREKFGSK